MVDWSYGAYWMMLELLLQPGIVQEWFQITGGERHWNTGLNDATRNAQRTVLCCCSEEIDYLRKQYAGTAKARSSDRRSTDTHI
jgi:hypothetical protein